MRIENVDDCPRFKPFAIVFETEEEAIQAYHLTNAIGAISGYHRDYVFDKYINYRMFDLIDEKLKTYGIDTLKI